MNILITGGLGYLGGRIAHYLKIKKPVSKIFLTTSDINRKLPGWVKQFYLLEMNLLDEQSIGNCLRNRKIDVIIHLGAFNEIDSLKDPELAIRVNALGTYKLLEKAHEKIGRFIYFSTFHVYGNTQASVITEETPARPFHPYAITHRSAEDFVNYFNSYYKMNTLIFRLSNGYGYPMDINVNRWTLVFNDLCKQAVTTGDMVLKSSGSQHRDFISLEDVARAVGHFLFKATDKWGDGLYNLGGKCSMSILDVAKKIAGVYQKKYNKDIGIKTRNNNSEATDSKPVNFNIDKIIKTGFILKPDMAEEIDKTLSICEEFIS